MEYAGFAVAGIWFCLTLYITYKYNMLVRRNIELHNANLELVKKLDKRIDLYINISGKDKDEVNKRLS